MSPVPISHLLLLSLCLLASPFLAPATAAQHSSYKAWESVHQPSDRFWCRTSSAASLPALSPSNTPASALLPTNSPSSHPSSHPCAPALALIPTGILPPSVDYVSTHRSPSPLTPISLELDRPPHARGHRFPATFSAGNCIISVAPRGGRPGLKGQHEVTLRWLYWFFWPRVRELVGEVVERCEGQGRGGGMHGGYLFRTDVEGRRRGWSVVVRVGEEGTGGGSG